MFRFYLDEVPFLNASQLSRSPMKDYYKVFRVHLQLKNTRSFIEIVLPDSIGSIFHSSCVEDLELAARVCSFG